MSVAILCPGPSLAAFVAEPVQHNCYIGVNRAAVAYPCDYWAFTDARPFDAACGQVQGLPACFTSQSNKGRLTVLKMVPRFVWLLHEEIGKWRCPRSTAWPNYSMTCAMVLAEHVIEHEGLDRQIDIYGADQSGKNDWDGPCPFNVKRDAYRWQNEQFRVQRVTEWLSERSIDVRRIAPEPAAAV